VGLKGGVTYEARVDATLLHGVLPPVVPQLRTITAGGVIAGVGTEATSFRMSLVHYTLLELYVLLPSGEVVVCTPDNAHRDLFLGFPNSLPGRSGCPRRCASSCHLRCVKPSPCRGTMLICVGLGIQEVAWQPAAYPRSS